MDILEKSGYFARTKDDALNSLIFCHVCHAWALHVTVWIVGPVEYDV